MFGRIRASYLTWLGDDFDVLWPQGQLIAIQRGSHTSWHNLRYEPEHSRILQKAFYQASNYSSANGRPSSQCHGHRRL
jgi:hypothetical protein